MPISTRRRHQAMCVDDHKPLFRQIGETNSETRFLLKLVNVDDEQKFPKTSVCIILVALVYLESAKIYTGPKTVRGLKRLRTTGISRHAAINTHKNKTMHWTTTFLNRTGWTILLTLNLTSVKVSYVCNFNTFNSATLCLNNNIHLIQINQTKHYLPFMATSCGILGVEPLTNSFKSISLSSIKCSSRPPPLANLNGMNSSATNPYKGSMFLDWKRNDCTCYTTETNNWKN